MLRTTASIIVAVVFMWSSISKARDLPTARRAADALTNTNIPAPLTPILIGAELVVAGLSPLPPTRPYGVSGAMLLLAIFTILIVRSLRSGRMPTCFCFGAATPGPISWLDVWRNVALGAIAAVALLG